MSTQTAVLVLDVDSREPLAAELDAFLAVARDGGRPVVDGEDGLWAVAIASALLSAAADRRPVELGGLLDALLDEAAIG